ncbi:MAG: arsenate reductase ArsC [Thermoplasmata archaeon]
MSGGRQGELSPDEGVPRDDRAKGEAGEQGSGRKSVLFICTHNSARSQMAEGLLRALHGDRYEAFSAGTEPARVHPLAIRVMAEVGVDISGQRSKSLEEFRGREFDWVVTVCDRAHQTCPFFPGGKIQLHRGFDDPAGAGGSEEERLAAFRRVRDELRDWIDSTFGKTPSGERRRTRLPEFRI